MREFTVVRDDGYNTDGSDSSCDVAQDIEAVFANEADFGVLFDVDGVLARGSTPLTAAVEGIRLLKDDQGNLRVPVAFVTNSCNRSKDKAAQIQKWLNIQVTPDQVIHAPTPVKLLTEFHDKHVLVIGQEYRVEIAHEIGFTNVCTLADIQKAYPLLDMVDHENRNAVAVGNHPDDTNFPAVEAVLLLGEPTHWESHLQLLIDLILTDGKPVSGHTPADVHKVRQLPVIACNMDLVFMHQACMPRFGHGAFLVCLEALYKKITGKDLKYTALIGKPCEITYRYAEHVINDVAKRMGINKPIRKLYFVGDNPDTDVLGANLYDRYLQRNWANEDNGNTEGSTDHDLPECRTIPKDAKLYKHTCRKMESLLVGTGVYKPDQQTGRADSVDVYHGHRDIVNEPELTKPTRFVPDVFHGMQHILKHENFDPNAVALVEP
ncbi:haloacid dehalogenase-like hydrolase domain-containing 5 isoform X2 [Dreissena polymorpha]|uniref:haloacid dehalogenase-like hydrolase domain-containing 5 isoform X2 n=1 Tax=Dreissena polymorpha TaxID=45954 RepID=UPI002263E5C0|nr:haloacid dehalogenase-like hydrolase domain-containing 5 isoform X2 [Dreissena polymorpha]